MAKTAVLAGVAEAPECDGSHFLFVNFDGQTFPVQVDPANVSKLLRRLQEAVFDQAEATRSTVSLPQFDVLDVALAHQGQEVGLMVTTRQTGKLVFRFADGLVSLLQSELARLTSYRRSDANPQ